ncbi:MAG: hypothetical protein V3U92_10850 [Cellulophaga sp.]
MKYFSYIVLSLLLSSSCFAGKIKSADNLLPKIQSEILEFQGVFKELKSYINNIEETGSFVKNDFWGIKPSFYFDKRSFGASSLYFLHKFVDDNLDHQYRNKYFVRTINNIKLYPIDLEEWTITLNFNYDEFFPNEWSKYSAPNILKDYFLSNNVPSENLNEALQEYGQFYDSIATLLLKGVVASIDDLYTGIYFDQSITSSEYFSNFFSREDVYDMKKHPKIMKEKGQDLIGSSLHNLLHIKTQDEFIQSLVNGELSGDASNILSTTVSIYRYKFNVGKDMDNSARTSQIIEFDLLLNKKVEQGLATSSEIKRVGYKSKFTVYSDNASSKYPSKVFFDKETGDGIWQIGYWNSKTELEGIKLKFSSSTEKLKVSFQKYLELKMKEIAGKYSSKALIESYSDEF